MGDYNCETNKSFCNVLLLGYFIRAMEKAQRREPRNCSLLSGGSYYDENTEDDFRKRAPASMDTLILREVS